MVSGGRPWELNQEAFDRLLARLAEDRRAAAQEYERVRRMLVNFFALRRCPNPIDEADETLDRVARKLGQGEAIERIHGYIFGVARRVFAESSRRRAREDAVVPPLGSTPSAGESRAAEDRSACLDECLPGLTAADRTLLAEYYDGQGREDQLARRLRQSERLGISYGALRVRAHRVRQQLAACVTACLRRKGWDLA